MSKITLAQTSEGLTPAQALAVGDALKALEAFLVADNETATEKNNALQKMSGLARKSIVGETNPKKSALKQPKSNKETK